MTTTRNPSFLDYRGVVYEVFRERIAVALYHTSNAPDTKERLEELVAFLVRIKNDTRWYSLSAPNITSFWSDFVEHELIFDFIMLGTSEIMFRLSLLDNYNEQKFFERLAESITVTRRPRDPAKRGQDNYASITPDEHVQRGLTKAQWETCFRTDTWVVFLYLMFILSIDAGAVIAEFTPPPRRVRKDVVDG